MAGTLLSTPDTDSVSLERLVQVAMERGYTAQGEMFSGKLAGKYLNRKFHWLLSLGQLRH